MDLAAKLYRFVLARLPDRAAIRLMNLWQFGRLPDLMHPRTFNEKIAWRKLYQRDPRFTLFSDKLAVKAEIARLIGADHVTKTLWSGARPGDIPFDALRPPYVIKASHGSGGNLFVRTETRPGRDVIQAFMSRQLDRAHGREFREWGYYGIPRTILIEPMIETPDGGVPDDYKFFVYHGRVHFVQVDRARFRSHTRDLYDRDWKTLPVRFAYPNSAEPAAAPPALSRMIEIAEGIGRQFDFVRVDLYAPPAGILFGEVTFYPEAGQGSFEPAEWDATFGAPWRIQFRDS